MNEKGKLNELKHQFISQKLHEKRVYNATNQQLKSQLTTVNKQKKLIKNENKRLFLAVNEGEKLVNER